MKTILVTGIGGNVGQGVLRNIRNLKQKITLIGTDVSDMTAGSFLCDRSYQVSYSWDEKYVSEIKKICFKESVDLIIPATDFELWYLKKDQLNLPQIVGVNSETAEIFLDKYLTYKAFKKKNIPFAESYLPSEFKKKWKQLVVKPRQGRGSRDVFINPINLDGFDDNFLIQKLLLGEEITTAFYVTKDKRILGSITFRRILYHGMTFRCEVVSRYNPGLNKIIKLMCDNFDIKGPCNIQSIVNNDGQIMPFEINCRISGTNSIRSQFGFEDVKYIVQEYLFNQIPKKPQITKGAALRMMMDVIYPGVSLKKVSKNPKKGYIY